MELEQIEISNYRSVKSETIKIKRINNSSTFCFIGINESGKSSLLKGISLFEEESINYPGDFYDEQEAIRISFLYTINSINLEWLRRKLIKEYKFDKKSAGYIEPTKVKIVAEYEPNSQGVFKRTEFVDFKNKVVKGYSWNDGSPIKISDENNGKKELNVKEFFEENLPDYFWGYSHDILFWESSDKYLILDEIDLLAFADNPEEISIPLANCFKLAGYNINEIPAAIEKLSSPAPIRNLESLLSDTVTKHINEIWPEHPVELKLEINNNKISLLIEDNGVKHKAKTAHQRSDGFKQFISFLLTLSTERINKELRKTIMLLDEPETHLHPQAQLNLLKELIRITTNTNHIVFYASHSNYLIDKINLNRNLKVHKEKNDHTKLSYVSKSQSSYSEVNYTVFDIATTDYHNELYGYLEHIYPSVLASLDKDRKWKNEKTGKEEKVSLSKYIRNSIHHPENSSNRAYSYNQLKKSIETMRKLKSRAHS